jgi:hypothetical protein
MPKEYEQLLAKIAATNRLHEFDDQSQQKILYFRQDEIGHSKPVLVARKEDGSGYDIFEFLLNPDGTKKNIGSGGHAIIRAARNILTGETVAIKELYFASSLLQTYREVVRVQRESSQKKQNCPMIPVYHYGMSTDNNHDQRIYVIMAQGKCDFESVCSERLTKEIKKQIMHDAMDLALRLFENKKFLGDFKGRNYLLDKDNHLRACDLEELQDYGTPRTEAPSFSLYVGGIFNWLIPTKVSFNDQEKLQKDLSDFLYQQCNKFKDDPNSRETTIESIKKKLDEFVDQLETVIQASKAPSKDDKEVTDIFGKLVSDMQYFQKDKVLETLQILSQPDKLYHANKIFSHATLLSEAIKFAICQSDYTDRRLLDLLFPLLTKLSIDLTSKIISPNHPDARSKKLPNVNVLEYAITKKSVSIITKYLRPFCTEETIRDTCRALSENKCWKELQVCLNYFKEQYPDAKLPDETLVASATADRQHAFLTFLQQKFPVQQDDKTQDQPARWQASFPFARANTVSGEITPAAPPGSCPTGSDSTFS